jgi:hypothetical protein
VSLSNIIMHIMGDFLIMHSLKMIGKKDLIKPFLFRFNAPFKNGIAEKIIRDLQEPVRKQFLDAKARWPAAVNANVWPYALRYTQHMKNSLPDRNDGACPQERFSGAEVAPNLKTNHTFGCPVYELNSKLASGKSIPKWDYLGLEWYYTWVLLQYMLGMYPWYLVWTQV